ncbi:serum paraoxonase/arylesterase-like protein [Hyaloscypha finlandica]|nr:serum paraoxonase/arylesterase-like protein [Hyaloscypha finlandica]
MSSTLRNFRLGVAVLMFGVLYQSWLKEVLFEVIGVGRVIQPIEDFPYKCRRLNHERLEACEDLWLDDQERVLYLACAGTESRIQWNPAIGGLNVSGRRPGGSELMALNIDSPGTNGMFGIHGIEPVGYDGATGDGTLDLLGFDVEVVDAATLRFWLINHRPPVDANKKAIDATKVGANSTIDVFELKRGEDKMVHVKTVFDPEVKTPNNIAAMGDGSFVATNDHSAKVGFRKELDIFIGGGNVAYCPASGPCKAATHSNFRFPNGLVRGTDGLVYVPESARGSIRVMELQEDGTLKEVDLIGIGMPIDNLSLDVNGDIWAAGLPKALQAVPAAHDPYKAQAPTTVWRVSKTPEGYKTFKVLEDRDMKVLTQIGTIQHDVKTGRLFIVGPSAPYLTICEPW